MNPDVGKIIEAANKRFCEAFRRHDAAAIAALYTANARLLPPQSDFVEGTDAIRDFWDSVMDMGLDAVSVESVEVDDVGDTAVEVGRWELRAGGSAVDHGKYIVVWKNDHGTWKLHRDVWNTSVPAAQAEQAA
jgi:ketosteroid isomerase-like protein